MSRRKRMTGKAEDMRQIAQVLRQNELPEQAVKAALLAMCGIEVMMTVNGSAFETAALRPLSGMGDGARIA